MINSRWALSREQRRSWSWSHWFIPNGFLRADTILKSCDLSFHHSYFHFWSLDHVYMYSLTFCVLQLSLEQFFFVRRQSFDPSPSTRPAGTGTDLPPHGPLVEHGHLVVHVVLSQWHHSLSHDHLMTWPPLTFFRRQWRLLSTTSLFSRTKSSEMIDV